jgi:DNA-binding HxlR family transcriptional regulator
MVTSATTDGRTTPAAAGATTAPLALEWSVENCTISRTLGVLGEKWTFIVLRDVFLGIRRFDDFIEHTGIGRQVLANRLAALVDAGLLRREAYQEPGERPRHEYRLTDKGIDVYPILVALREWGDRYAADAAGPPLLTVHRDCGASVSVQLACAAGHELDSPREVVPRPGPNARRRTRASQAAR